MQNDVVPSRRRVRAGTQGIPIAELSVESFTAPITAYMRSYFLTARAAVRRMVEKRSGVMLVHTPEREDAYAGVERWSEAFNSGDCLRQGTRVAFDAMVSAFPPALSPRRVTIVTKFFCTDTEPQHGPHMFGSGWRRVLTWDRSPGCLPDARITAIRMIVERITESVSPSIETSSASLPRRMNVTASGPGEK